MKNIYTTPQLEVVLTAAADVITASEPFEYGFDVQTWFSNGN